MSYVLFRFGFSVEISSHVAQAGLELAVLPRLEADIKLATLLPSPAQGWVHICISLHSAIMEDMNSSH